MYRRDLIRIAQAHGLTRLERLASGALDAGAAFPDRRGDALDRRPL